MTRESVEKGLCRLALAAAVALPLCGALLYLLAAAGWQPMALWRLGSTPLEGPAEVLGYNRQAGAYTPDGDDPQLIYPAGAGEARCVVVMFARPLAEAMPVRVYYAEPEGGFSEKMSTGAEAPAGARMVALELPSAQYERYRLDLDGSFDLAGVYATGVGGAVRFWAQAALLYLGLLLLLLVAFSVAPLRRLWGRAAAWWRGLSRRAVKLGVGAAVALALTAVYSANLLGAVDGDLFRTWQYDSEGLVTGRLARNAQAGSFSESALLRTSWDDQTYYQQGLPPNGYELDVVYTSQVGIQGLLWALPNALLPLSNAAKLAFFRVMDCLLLGLLLGGLVVWVFSHYGGLVAGAVFAGLLFNQWLTLAARNLYWAPWTMLLPMVAVLLFHWFEERLPFARKGGWLFGLVFLCVFLRAGSGFEFITCVLVATEVPVLLYALRERWGPGRWVARSALVGGAGVAGCVAALLVNFGQLAAYFGGAGPALAEMAQTADKRTGLLGSAFFGGLEDAEAIHNSLQVPLSEVLGNYLDADTVLAGGVTMGGVLWLFAAACLLFALLARWLPARRPLAALCAAGALAGLGSLSWLVLGKGHSVVHYFINFLVWSVPAIPWMLAFAGATVAAALRLAAKKLSAPAGLRAKTG